MVAVSSAPSRSCPTVTVMVCGTFQSFSPNVTRFVRGEPSVSTVTSALSLVASMVTLHPLPGFATSATV